MTLLSSRPRPLGLLLVLVVACTPQAPAYGQSSPGLDPGSRIDLFLERGRFLEPLPFDVQFFLRGDAAEDLVSASGRFAHLTREVRACAVALPPGMPQSGPGGTVLIPLIQEQPAAPQTEQPPPTPKKPPRIYAIDEARPFLDQGKRQFELSVDPLQPNQDYCFEFSLRYRVAAEDVRAVAIEGLDTTLQGLLGKEDTVAQDKAYDLFRQRLVEAIIRVARRKSLEKGIPIVPEVPAKSFFDLTLKAQDIPLLYRQQFTRELSAQANVGAAIRRFSEAAGLARDAGTNLLPDPRFVQMLRQVNAQSGDPLLRLRLTGLEAAIGLLNRSEAQVRAAPFGLVSGDTPEALDQVWVPAGVADRVRNLDARAREFEQLRDLAKSLSESPSLRATAGLDAKLPSGAVNPQALTEAQLTAVAGLAEQARVRFAAARTALEAFQRELTDRRAAIEAMAADITGETTQLVSFRGTTTSGWETRAKQYISVDVGLATSQPIDSTFFYVGTNFYTGPVNKRAPLHWHDQSFRKRFAVTFGIPLNPFADDKTVDQFSDAPAKIEGVIGARPLLSGVGWRLTDVMRFTFGTVMFKVRNPNPLIDSKLERHFTWFFGASVDWDIKNFFAGLAGATPGAPQK
jgi:hypothetical protein